MLRSLGCVTLLLSLAAPAAAQQPSLVNGRLSPEAGGSSLQPTFTSLVARQSDPAWIGYAVPAAKGSGTNCCSDGYSWGRCGLEPAPGPAIAGGTAGQAPRTVKLEGPTTVFVLYRVEGKAIGKIRFYSEDCQLDAGGLTLHWLDGVKPAESVALLSTFIRDDAQRTDRVANSALAAVAAHADPSAVPALITFARQDPSTRVRGQALFWLAQKAGQQAAAEITAAIENDPDTEVKRRAVFALSQLPKDEGVPLLIQVAKSNKNPVVRKQAMFWLGQSKDPRALAFFEQVLGRQ